MGATQLSLSACAQELVSTHAPVMGATHARRRHKTRPHRFNPRARDGRDLKFCVKSLALLRVSTHAPVMGATLRC